MQCVVIIEGDVIGKKRYHGKSINYIPLSTTNSVPYSLWFKKTYHQQYLQDHQLECHPDINNQGTPFPQIPRTNQFSQVRFRILCQWSLLFFWHGIVHAYFCGFTCEFSLSYGCAASPSQSLYSVSLLEGHVCYSSCVTRFL